MKRYWSWTWPLTTTVAKTQRGVVGIRPGMGIYDRSCDRCVYYAAPLWVAWLYRILPCSAGYCFDRGDTVKYGAFTLFVAGPSWSIGTFFPWRAAHYRYQLDVNGVRTRDREQLRREVDEDMKSRVLNI